MISYAILFFLLLLVIALAAIWNIQNKILKEFKRIHIPEPQRIEFPNIEFPKIEIPPAKEISLDLNPVVEAVKSIPSAKEINIDLNPVVEAVKNIQPAKEVSLDLNPVIEAINKSVLEIKNSLQVESLQNIANTQSDLVKILQETSTLMRVNQAEFQSGLEAFHKAIDKLLAQIPNDEKEHNAQKEFMQKFEAAFVNVQEKTTEAISENSLRLQEILAEFLNKEQKG